MLKRCIDVVLSGAVLVLACPLIGLCLISVWVEDRQNPIYAAPRVGRGGRVFRMYKVRTMSVHADKSGVASTAADDLRITRVGGLLRRAKLDELPQFWNVFRGDMSLVGPRPNAVSEVELYTSEERRLLSVRPGITDWSSIVFADEGEILLGHADPNEAYRQLIRPWKSRLGLLYVARGNVAVDIRILQSTVQSFRSRPRTLRAVSLQVARVGGAPELERVARREDPLAFSPPPDHEDYIARGPVRKDYVPITEGWMTLASREQREAAYFRARLATDLADGGTLIDVACGTGLTLEFASEFVQCAVGGDLMLGNVMSAKRQSRLSLTQLDAQHLPFRDCTADVVACLEALYYLPDVEQFLAEAVRVLKPGGRLLLSAPNPERPGFNPSPGSTRYLDAEELRSALLKAGLRPEILGAFQWDLTSSKRSQHKEVLRRVAVKLGLIPNSMRVRGILKRLLMSDVRPLHDFMMEGEPSAWPPEVTSPDRRHLILYAIGRRQ